MVTLAGFPYSKTFSRRLQIVWSFFPPNLFAKALDILSSATSTPQHMGISWSKRTECATKDKDCVMTIVSRLFKTDQSLYG